MNYALAWLVIGVAGLMGTLGLFFLTRSVAHAGLRWVLRLLPLCLMVAPAPVPDYEGHIAPAFIVFTFESLFQAQGTFLPAGIILLIAGITSVCSGLLTGRLGSRETDQEVGSN